MVSHSRRSLLVFVAVSLFCCRVPAIAADPGTAYPASAEVSDQKAGSVLLYPYYTSSAAAPSSQNTRINITQTAAAAVAVRLFLVSDTGSVADTFLCLAANQTASFLASDVDPGTSGYIVAVAVDANGCPVSSNTLIGDAFVKRASGHSANLGAYAIAALYSGSLAGCGAASTTATLDLNGTAYNQVPRTVALDRVVSRALGNDKLLILDRVGGNLATPSIGPLGTILLTLYDNGGNPLSASFSSGHPQFVASLTGGGGPNTGWLKLWAANDFGLLGAVINFNPNASTAALAFNGGHGLRTLTTTSSASWVIPVFAPNC